MCGIVGYIGDEDAVPVLMHGLYRLEYRGYDSAGIAVIKDGKLQIKKCAGKVALLDNMLSKDPISGSVGISHTRWATHGVPSETNSHPHIDCRSRIAIVHNGIIENYELLKKMLILSGHHFRSQTDTEALVHLIEDYYKGDIEDAVRRAIKEARGAYAIGVICIDEPDKIVAARLNCPLIVGLGKGENFFASDVPAIFDRTKRVLYIDDHEVVVIKKDDVSITTQNGRRVLKRPSIIKWDLSKAEKCGYPHFMLKEIEEQPETILETMMGRISKSKDEVVLKEIGLSKDELLSVRRVVIIACGTAYYAGLVGKYAIEELSFIPTEVDISSEFRYRNPALDSSTLIIAISQSGETADTIAGVREAKARGVKVIAICNCVGSSITREVDGVLYTHAGPEIAVASTKAYTSQLTALYLLAIYLGTLNKELNRVRAKRLIAQIEKAPSMITKIIRHQGPLLKVAKEYYNAKNFLYLARHINYPTAFEGALKLKEICYIHAEGYGAGEMKHGPIALITKELPVVCIATESKVYDKLISNIQEIRSRGGIIISVATEGDSSIKRYSNHTLFVPKITELLSPIINVVPLQLLAYHIAVLRGCDVDKPRNLAKSVTVE